MEKSKIAKIKTKKMNKKAIMGLVTKVFVFLAVILALIIGSAFAATSFSNKANLGGDFGKNYNGYYDIKVATYDANKSKPEDDKKLGDAEQGYKILRDKIDPLSIKNFDIQIIGDNHIKMTIPKSLYADFTELQSDIERQGAIYFTDTDGTDLLVDSATKTRVKLSDIIETSEAKVNKLTRQPIISLKFKDKSKWDSMMEKNKDKPLMIWTDIPNFIDKIRHDSNNYTKWKGYFKNLIASKELSDSEKKAVRAIFDFKTDGTGNAKTTGNLIDINDLPIANAVFKNASLEFNVKVNDSEGLLIDPNNDTKGEAANPYIDPLRGTNAKQILMKLYALSKEEYGKYLLNTERSNFDPQLNQSNTESYDIVVDTATRATQIETLINGSLKGLSFKIESYANSDNLNKKLDKSSGFINGIVILSIAAGLIVIFLLVYYRLFGLITITSIAFTAIFGLFLGSLLNISVALEVVSALFIAICLVVYANVLLYERYKRERFYSNKQLLTSFKVANKATLPAIIDTAIVILILGLAFFWGGSGILKSFATILIIATVSALITGVFITRLLYYLAIKLKMVDNKILAIPKNGLFINFKKQKVKSVKANLMTDNNEIIEVNSSESNNDVKRIKKSASRKVTWLSIVKWTPLGAVSLIILAIILGFTIGINKAPNISQGYQYTIAEEIMPTDNLNEEVKQITNAIEKDFKNQFNFEISKIVTSNYDQFDEQAIEINTNITKDELQQKFLKCLYNKYTSDEQFIKSFKIKSTASQSVIIEAIIALAISIALILVYLLFRLDWAQFTAIVIGVVSTLLISFAIIASAQLIISFEMISCFITIASLTLMTGVIMMSRAKQIKGEVSKDVYENFWNEEMKYKQDIKTLKKQHKLFIKAEIAKLNNTNEKLSDEEYNNKKREIYKQAKAMKKDDAKQIALVHKEFRAYEHENNFLINISKRTILESTKNLIIMSFIFATLIIGLLFFPIVLTNSFSFEILLAIGIFTGIYATLFIILPIWSFLEKKRTLSHLRVRKYLDSKRFGLDEQLIKGINS